MLNIASAPAAAVTLQTADTYAAQAAAQAAAGFGAGAFVYAGALTGLAGYLMPTPDVVSGTGITAAKAAWRLVGAGYETRVVDIVQVDSVQRDTHNYIQTALLNPGTRGGVGPHPAREPEPV